MSERRRGLGRGIGALIPTPPESGQPGRVAGAAVPGLLASSLGVDPTETAAAGHGEPDRLVDVPGTGFAELPVSQITPNPRQPRNVFDADALDELVHSIREIGVLQPVVVRRGEPEGGEPRYELVVGERRWRACQSAGLERIPAVIRATDDDAMLRDALLENLHRVELNPLEEAAAYRQLLDDFGCTQDELSQRIGRSRPQISNTLRLLKLPPGVQRRVGSGVLSAGHARALLALDDPELIDELAGRIVREGLSVRSVEEIVAAGGPRTRRSTGPRPGAGQPLLDDVASRLADRFETRVRITLGKNRGKLTVDFASVDDLNRILAVMEPGGPGAHDGIDGT